MIDWEEADKKLSKIEQYWMDLDLSRQQDQQELINQITQGREQSVKKLVDKLPPKDVLRERIENFRNGGDIEEDVNELVKEVRSLLDLASKHPAVLRLTKRVSGVQKIYPVIKNQVDPSAILIHIRHYDEELYKTLIREHGGFEYIKLLTLSTWREVEDDIKELDEQLQQQQQPQQGMGGVM